MRVVLLVLAILAVLGLGCVGWALYGGHERAADAVEAQYVTSSDQFVEIDGARVRVRTEGPANAPVLVLIHGFTLSLETWDVWADALKSDYRVVRYDLLGHGLTGPDAQQRYSPEERSVFLEQVLDSLSIERAAIAGNSLGGTVAWRFAAASPDRVTRLILVDAGAFPFGEVGDDPAPVNFVVKALMRSAPKPVVAGMYRGLFADPDALSDERMDEIYALMRREGNGQAFVDHLFEFALPDPRADLARITAPTLVIWGAEDPMLPVEQANMIADAIPDACSLVIEGVGHAPQEEAAELTLAAVREFLSEGSGP